MNIRSGIRLYMLVFLVSLVMLGFELLFPQILIFLPERKAVTTIIAIAMLGIGAGGILFYLVSERPASDSLARSSLSCLGLSILASFAAAVWVPWYPLIVIAAALPFAFSSLFLSLAFVRASSSRIYFINLLGSGAGAGMVFWLEPLLGEESCLILFALIALAAGGHIILHAGFPARWFTRGLFYACLGLLLFNIFTEKIDLIRLIPPSRVPAAREHDALSFGFRVLHEPDTLLLASDRNMIARVDAIHAPGYDISSRFLAKGLADMKDPNARREFMESLSSPVKLYFNDHLWSLMSPRKSIFAELPPYNILSDPSVLIIGPGGGVDIAKAVYNNARRIVAVEINPGVVRLMQGPLRKASENVYGQAEIKVMDGRTWLLLSKDKFDLIHLAFADLYVPFIHSDIFMENYLYTKEAFEEYFKHLTPEGIIAVHKYVRGASWNKDLFRILSTSVQVLKDQSLDHSKHLFFAGVEGRPDEYYGFILIKRSPFTPSEIKKMESSIGYPFQVFHSPGRRISGNPFSEMIHEPEFNSYLASCAFDISPVTDDRPFFYLFDRSRSIIRGFFNLFILIITAFIFIPLIVIFAKRNLLLKPSFHAYWFYFAIVAVGYMLLQTTMIQRFNLFLGSPLYAMGVVITTFLVLASLGSELSARMSTAWQRLAILCVPLLILVFALFLDDILKLVLIPGLGLRIAFSVIILAPLCFVLGFPFPQGLSRAKARWGEQSAALMYAINGSFSALGVTLFSLLAPDTGIIFLFKTAGILYLITAILFIAFSRRA
jgi:SAM-dependent methyltransferase